MREPNDAELVSAASHGNREAYASLVRRHASRVYAVCLAMLHDPDDSQDAAQDVLIKGLEKIHSLRDGNQFAMWITRIAQNHCRDHWRTQKRRDELLHKHSQETSVASESSTPDLSDALARLPDKYRLPLMLYYFDGQSIDNLAKALDISRAGVGSRLARARHALRRLLEKSHG
ncbi:MAG: RNA polymerase sigma factor [Candidatus Latescibacterota bacterium]|nr:MAG: RNA polymerase sigma factor [Candidatus Latescibacterota bacterium]